jgi:hypothetical protein
MDFYSQLRTHANKTWTIQLETPMHKTRFKISPQHDKWQPDGLAMNLQTKELILLELTRCNDSRHDTTQPATTRKQIKYDALLQDLQNLNNTWKFSLHTTAIGYLTTVSEPTLITLYNRLGISTAKHKDITKTLICTTARAFAKMAKERLAALHLSQTQQGHQRHHTPTNHYPKRITHGTQPRQHRKRNRKKQA